MRGSHLLDDQRRDQLRMPRGQLHGRDAAARMSEHRHRTEVEVLEYRDGVGDVTVERVLARRARNHHVRADQGR
ncbi:hypothetical protein ACQP0C_39820 [Nocardia sp. CA-129566]|uniref:hypothetical protein n=1 Tax=Nocardia sp. CA-129566 TaxID=3239976 RepID=UPI003D9809FD